MRAKHTDSRGVVRVLDRTAYLAQVLRRTGRDASRDLVTCGHCLRTWDDGIVTGVTPTPAARCPFEDQHKPDRCCATLRRPDTMPDITNPHATFVRPLQGSACLASSRNLRALRDYARRHPVACVITRRHVEPITDHQSPCGVLHVVYADGAIGRAFFRSHAILIDWVRNRRTWRHAEMRHLDGTTGYLTRPGVIAGPQKAANPPAGAASTTGAPA